MSEKKVDRGCQGGCKPDAANGCEDRANCSGAFGAKMAEDAVNKIKAQDEVIPSSPDIEKARDADIAAFLSKCADDGVSPLDAVQVLADDAGIDLNADRPKEADRGALWEFLRAVVLKWSVDVVTFVAHEVSGGSSLKDALMAWLCDRFGFVGGLFSGRDNAEEERETGRKPRTAPDLPASGSYSMFVKRGGVTVGYAFNW